MRLNRDSIHVYLNVEPFDHLPSYTPVDNYTMCSHKRANEERVRQRQISIAGQGLDGQSNVNMTKIKISRN